MRHRSLLMALVLLAAACGSPLATPSQEQSGEGEAAAPDLSRVPVVDTSRHTVPLEDVVFDTFDGGFRGLHVASESLMSQLRDLIEPIYEPAYHDAASAAQWLEEADRVIGIEVDGQAYAYPTRTLNFREIVNEVLGGTPLVITYCPLCASGVVYDRRLNGKTLLLGNTSALYDNDMVMFDHETGSFWHQLSGQAIVGTLSGEQLEPLPSTMATFGQWRAAHPDTLVLSNSHAQAAARSDSLSRVQQSVNAGRFFFPVTDQAISDPRLELGTEVLLLRVSGNWKAYPVFESTALAANDRLGGAPLVVLAWGVSASAYFASVDGRVLTFAVELGGPTDPARFRDDETGTLWDLAGMAVEGALEGTRLEPIPTRRGFWFAVAGANPGVELYTP